MKPFDIMSAVICDDIRVEQNGKLILIGVYIDTIIVKDFPSNLLLAFWFEVLPSDLGKLEAEFRIVKDDESILIRGKTIIEINNKNPTAINLQKIPLEFQKGGTFAFQWKIGDADWETAKTFNVEKAETTNLATAS